MAQVTWRNLPPFVWKTFRRLARRKEPTVGRERGKNFVSPQEYAEALKNKNLTLRWANWCLLSLLQSLYLSCHVSPLLSRVPSSVTCPLSCHVSPLLSRVPSPVTCPPSCHMSPLLSRVPSPVTCPLSCHVSPLLSRVPSPVTCPLSCHVSPLLSRVPSPVTCPPSCHVSSL